MPERQVPGNVLSEESRNHARGDANQSQSFSALFSSTRSADEAETETTPSPSSGSENLHSNGKKERRTSYRNGVNLPNIVPGVPDLFALLPLSLKLPVGLGFSLSGAAQPEKISTDQSAVDKEGNTPVPSNLIQSNNATTTDLQTASLSYGELAFGLHLSNVDAIDQSEDHQPTVPPKTNSDQRPEISTIDLNPEPGATMPLVDQASVPIATTLALKDPSDSSKRTPDISTTSQILAINPDSGQGTASIVTATNPGAQASQSTSTAAANVPVTNESRMADVPRTAAPVREISIALPGADLSKVAIQLTERNGDLRVSVRTADPNLAGDLRLDLKDLVSNLKQDGFKVESWTPTISVVETQAHGHDHHESGNNDQQQHGGGNTGQQNDSPRDQRRQRQAYPAWIAEFENYADNTGTARMQNS